MQTKPSSQPALKARIQRAIAGLCNSWAAVVLVCAMALQPVMAQIVSNGPSAQRVQISDLDDCGGSCCCAPKDAPGARFRCPCGAKPMAPADVPAPFFAPGSDSETSQKGKALFLRGQRAPLYELVAASSNKAAQNGHPIHGMQRAGPLIRGLARELQVHLACLQKALI